jgi:hypothetical protein
VRLHVELEPILSVSTQVPMVTMHLVRRAPILGAAGPGASFSNPVTPRARKRWCHRETVSSDGHDGRNFLLLLAAANNTLRAWSTNRLFNVHPAVPQVRVSRELHCTVKAKEILFWVAPDVPVIVML